MSFEFLVEIAYLCPENHSLVATDEEAWPVVLKSDCTGRNPIGTPGDRYVQNSSSSAHVSSAPNEMREGAATSR